MKIYSTLVWTRHHKICMMAHLNSSGILHLIFPILITVFAISLVIEIPDMDMTRSDFCSSGKHIPVTRLANNVSIKGSPGTIGLNTHTMIFIILFSIHGRFAMCFSHNT